MIPKIIHQTWKSRHLPERYANWARSFQRWLPDWEYRLWDDQDCQAFVAQAFPGHLRTYDSLPNPAQRADLFRYMVLYQEGGLYADVDCHCKRTLDFIEPADDFIVGLELHTSSRRVMELYQSDMPILYCQWTFLAKPQHPILLQLIEEISRGLHSKISDDPLLEVIKRTGPHAFTKSVADYLRQDGRVKILPPSYFGCCDSSSLFRFMITFMFPELFRKVYVRHHFEGTWMDKKAKRDMLKRNLLMLKPKVARSEPN